MIGTVRKYFADRGFGFLTADDGNDFFFHVSELKRAGQESIEVGA